MQPSSEDDPFPRWSRDLTVDLLNTYLLQISLHSRTLARCRRRSSLGCRRPKARNCSVHCILEWIHTNQCRHKSRDVAIIRRDIFAALINSRGDSISCGNRNSTCIALFIADAECAIAFGNMAVIYECAARKLAATIITTVRWD